MKQIGNNNSVGVVDFILTRQVEELSTLTSQKIAGALGLNSRDITRDFESAQHIPLDRFITREKIYRAFFIIEREPGISLEELAKGLGFFDLQQFIKEFESYMLVHPARYKELVQMKEISH